MDNDSGKKNHLGSKVLEEMRDRLKHLYGDLGEEMHLHKQEIRQEMPRGQEDALPYREELELIEKEDSMEDDELLLIEEALQRIEDGTFGTCLDCGKPIPIERFRALPHAKYCVPCEEKRETKKGPEEA